MAIWESILFTALPAGLANTALWVLAPAIAARTAWPYLTGYLFCWAGSEMVIFSAALLAFRRIIRHGRDSSGSNSRSARREFRGRNVDSKSDGSRRGGC
jgi:hypothetical protein